MNLSEILEAEILPAVTKPSRYLGSELNSVHKDLKDIKVRIALTFPDLYDIGLGNLGLHILYAVLNGQSDVWAERVYAPGIDMEQQLRKRGLPLFALESKDSLANFDGIGFTLQSELTYTNILNILDMSKIPLRVKDRREEDPLTFCGGPAVFNPEPLVPFMDFFVFGDGEDIVLEISDVLKNHGDRKSRLKALSQVEGIYVPELFPYDILEDGQILPSNTVPKIRKRIARDLNAATFPVDYIVPFTRQVHDRISLEVLRGCTQGCRFCQAGMTTRPVRERSIDNIENLMNRTLDATGYEEVSLVSLSTCDYSEVRSMVQRVVQRASPDHIGVSLPSLRLDSFAVELADMVAGIRRTGLTFAPEAASPRLRAVINKWIPDEELLQMSSEAYKRGWDHVKLYFMIGLPTERDDDVDAIADLTLKTLRVGKSFNPKAKVNTGVSTFVPKPFTPFQWAAQITPEETERRQSILSAKIGHNSSIKFGRHCPEETFLEGLVSRADRRAGELLLRAFELGCRFDAWDEHRNIGLWNQAIEELNYDVAFQMRERSLEERLPWDHIDILIPKRWFQEDWKRATELKHAEDCRHSKCHRCGLIDEERDLCAHMLRSSIAGRKAERTFTRLPNPYLLPPSAPGKPPERHEPPAVQRLIFRIGLLGPARYLSHLETTNAWLRTLRRARLPLSYSQGFHPHPKVAFESARPVAEQSLGSYMDVILSERVDPSVILHRLQQVTAEGFYVFSVKEIPLKSPSLMGTVEQMDYLVELNLPQTVVQSTIDKIISADEINVERRAKKKKRRGKFRRAPKMRTINMRPHIKELRMFLQSEEDPALRAANQVMSEAETSTAGREKSTIYASIVRINERGMRPMELVKLFGLDPEQARVVRVKTHFTRSNTIHSQEDSDTEFTWHLKNRLDDKHLNAEA